MEFIFVKKLVFKQKCNWYLNLTMRKCRYSYEDGREKRTRSSCESCEFRAIRNKVAVIVSS